MAANTSEISSQRHSDGLLLRALCDCCAQLLTLGPDASVRDDIAAFLDAARAADADAGLLLQNYVVLQRDALANLPEAHAQDATAGDIASGVEQVASLEGLPVYASVADAIEGALGRILAQERVAAVANKPLHDLEATVEAGINWYELAALLDELSTWFGEWRGSGVDAATGLPAEDSLERLLGGELERLQRFGHGFCVAWLEITQYESLLAAYGQAAAEKALRLVARITQGALRGVDSIARVGEGGLLLILPQTSATDAERVIDDINALIQRSPFHFAGQPTEVGLRFGVVNACAGDTCQKILDDARFKADSK